MQEHEQRAGVEPAELGVLRVEAREIGTLGQGLGIVVQRQLSREELGQHALLSRFVPVDARRERVGWPETCSLGGNCLRVEDRRVEVSGRCEHGLEGWARLGAAATQSAANASEE